MDYFSYTCIILIILCFIGIFYCKYMIYKNNIVYKFRVGLLNALDRHTEMSFISQNQNTWSFHSKMFEDVMKFLEECTYDDMVKKSLSELKYNKILHGKYYAELRPYLPEEFL